VAPVPVSVPVSVAALAPDPDPVAEPEPVEHQVSFEAWAREKMLTAEGRAELERVVAAARARWSFAEFFRQAWNVVEPSTELVWNWHHLLLCTVLQVLFMDWLSAKTHRNYINLVRNVIVNIPPGTSKSKVISVCFMAWCWIHAPGMKFIALSVNDDATMRDARDARMLIQSPWFRASFGIQWMLKADQDAISNFGNTAGGERLSMPSKSEIVGLRADCLINDDPNNPKKSESKKERDEVNELWTTNQYNRVNDAARSLRIGVQQRTNDGDWTGFVLEQQLAWSPENPHGWLHVIIPAELELDRKFRLPEPIRALVAEYMPNIEVLLEDPRTIEGETLDKERLPSDVLASYRKLWDGTGNYAGQMQQRPTMVAGGAVQRTWFNFCRLAAGVRDHVDEVETGRPRPAHCHDGDAQVVHAAPLTPDRWHFDWITISIDPALKKTDRGSNWGLLVVAGRGGRRYVLDDRTRRGALHEIIGVLKEMIRFWEPDTILIEAKAAGDSAMDTLREAMGDGDLPMVSIEMVDTGSEDKEQRLTAVTPYLKNGMVYLLDGATWLEAFVEELAMFPNGKRDDRVDALSQVLSHSRPVDDGGLPGW
jgi:predicted phage terminase large subunit-like protein